MAPDGRLLAIVSRGVASPLSDQPHVTIANGISPDALNRLITADRAQR